MFCQVLTANRSKYELPKVLTLRVKVIGKTNGAIGFLDHTDIDLDTQNCHPVMVNDICLQNGGQKNTLIRVTFKPLKVFVIYLAACRPTQAAL